MVYSIAAYTITIGTLALYGVVIQYRSRVALSVWAESTGGVARDARSGFNLGASLLAPVWMWAHGLRIPAAVFLILGFSMVPLYQREMWTALLLVGMVPVAGAAALGFAGNRIAADHRGIEKPAAFAASQLPWALAGIVISVFVVPWALYLAGVFSCAIGSS